MNVAIILAAGYSSRFKHDVPKQLYELHGKPIISYSIDLLSNNFDQVVVVTNSAFYKQISKINSITLVNDKDTRIDSIRVALNYCKKLTPSNLLIHDAARPFITQNSIKILLESSKQYLLSQFCLKMKNGLVKKTNLGYEVVDRDLYLELCTPQFVNYKVYEFVFENFITKNVSCEILPIFDILKIQYNLIEGSYKELRKITTLEDLYL